MNPADDTTFQCRTPAAPLPAAAPAEDPLVAELAEEMGRRWRQGDHVLTEAFLERRPELRRRPADALGLIYEEVCLRQQHGLPVVVEELCGRFPQWGAQLELMLECHELFEAPAAAPDFPRAGDTVAGYQLLSPLGAGAGGRVFLARQPTLADRPVVVKLTSLQGHEHLRLARLQHTYIVPLYTAHDEPARNLRLLCMPYFGGAALDQVLRSLADSPYGQRTGDSLLGVLRDAGVQPAGPAEPVLRRLSYVQALCWIGACLAEALDYAHEGGLLHLDLKPSNVLIAADGQPMLLDFHLARAPLRPGERPEGIGGTYGYMPPEQEAALAAVGRGDPVPAAVDHRADVFGLGAVLYEALGGQLPFVPRQSAPLYRRNGQVSVGLSDILEKCLAPHPADRYPTAAALAEDLRRHLADQPLAGVRNRSWAERLGKWRRRRPAAFRTLLLLAVLVGALAALATGALSHWNHVVLDIRRALEEGHQLWAKEGRYEQALGQLRHGLQVAQSLPFQDDLRERLDEEIGRAIEAQAVAQRREQVRQLHALAEQVRVLAGAEALPAGQRAALEARCREFWDRRRQIRDWFAASPAPGAAEDLIDLALFAAELRLRAAPRGQEATARRQYLADLDEAEALFGPGAVLDRQRRQQRRALGLPAPESPPVPARTAWEHFTLGRLALQEGDLAAAQEHLRQARRTLRDGFWPNYYSGLCADRAGQPDLAVAAFGVCIGAQPRAAAAYHNRALAYTALGRRDEAVDDYSRALELDPSLAASALNRGMLRYEAKDYAGAEADLRRALEAGADPAAAHYDLALVYHAQADDARTRAELRAALAAAPGHADARRLLDRLGAR